MSYIVRSGRLAGPVDLKSDEDGTLTAHATLIVNDRARDPKTGTWYDAATTAYRLTVRGRTAQRLTDFQERSGNQVLVFAGDYKIRTYTAPDGTQRLSHDVWVDHLGVDLAAHDVQTLTPQTPTPPATAEGANPWAEESEPTENPF